MVNWTLICLLSANVLSNSCYSLVVPFLPLELDKWGIDISIIGYIFCMYSVAVIIGSPIVGKALTRIGRKVILVGGLCSMGVSMIGFGASDLSPSKELFTFLVFFFRFCQGASSCSIQTTSYAVISMTFPQEQEKYIAMMQTAIGMGLILGPVIGTFLYSIFGFSSTFFIIGVCFLFLTFCLQFLIPSSIDKKDDDAPLPDVDRRISLYEEHVGMIDLDSVSFSSLLSISKFTLAGMGGMMAVFMQCYMEPVLAFRLNEFKISDFAVGSFFAIQPFSFMLLSLIITNITSIFANRGVIIFGSLICGFAMFLVGPSHYLPDSLIIMSVGQFIIGAFGLFMMVPAIPEMINAASKKYPKKIIEITDVSAGVFNCCLGVGMIVAPIYGSNMTKIYDFSTCSDVVGIVLLVYVLAYFMLGGGIELLKAGCKEKVKKQFDVIREDIPRTLSIRVRVFSGQAHDGNFDLDTLKLLRNEPLLDDDANKEEDV